MVLLVGREQNMRANRDEKSCSPASVGFRAHRIYGREIRTRSSSNFRVKFPSETAIQDLVKQVPPLCRSHTRQDDGSQAQRNFSRERERIVSTQKLKQPTELFDGLFSL